MSSVSASSSVARVRSINGEEEALVLRRRTSKCSYSTSCCPELPLSTGLIARLPVSRSSRSPKMHARVSAGECEHSNLVSRRWPLTLVTRAQLKSGHSNECPEQFNEGLRNIISKNASSIHGRRLPITDWRPSVVKRFTYYLRHIYIFLFSSRDICFIIYFFRSI